MKDKKLNYTYVKVSYMINACKNTEGKKYRPSEIVRDNYLKYVITIECFL